MPFLPLNTRHSKEQSAQQQPRDSPQATSSSTPPTDQVTERDQAEDEWATTSEEDLHHSPSMKGKRKTNGGKSQPPDPPLSSEDEARILPYMPALFSDDLPPCGPEPQVAYVNVVNRLRAQWLQTRGQVPATELCNTIRELLSNQNFLFPPLTQKGPNKRRKPWRREKIFIYELRWIDYFIAEATHLEKAVATEKELSDRQKEQTIPAVLGFNTDRSDVLKLWDAWHAKKRIRTPSVPEHASLITDTHSGADAEVSQIGTIEESFDKRLEKRSPDGSDLAVAPTSTRGLQEESGKEASHT